MVFYLLRKGASAFFFFVCICLLRLVRFGLFTPTFHHITRHPNSSFTMADRKPGASRPRMMTLDKSSGERPSYLTQGGVRGLGAVFGGGGGGGGGGSAASGSASGASGAKPAAGPVGEKMDALIFDLQFTYSPTHTHPLTHSLS